MKFSLLVARVMRTGATKPGHFAQAAPRFRRPGLHLERLEDRAVLSAAGDIEWLQQFGSFRPGAADLGRAVDADGNVYIAGQVAGALLGQASSGLDDAFVSKFDAAGNELWTRQFGTAHPDQASGVAVDASGVYVIGTTSGTLPGQMSAGGEDVFVRKYDAAGSELWTRAAEGVKPFALQGTASHLGRYTCYGEVEFLPGEEEGTLDGQGVAVFESANGDLLVAAVTWNVDAGGDLRTSHIHFSWRDSVEFGDGTIVPSTGRFVEDRPPGLVVIAIIAILIGLLLPAVQ